MNDFQAHSKDDVIKVLFFLHSKHVKTRWVRKYSQFYTPKLCLTGPMISVSETSFHELSMAREDSFDSEMGKRASLND